MKKAKRPLNNIHFQLKYTFYMTTDNNRFCFHPLHSSDDTSGLLCNNAQSSVVDTLNSLVFIQFMRP